MSREEDIKNYMNQFGEGSANIIVNPGGSTITMPIKTYNIGIDLTIGKYITVEATTEEEAIEIATKEAEDHSNIGSSRGWHFVGVKEQ